jgi:flagellar hook-basal body complex protein FliE
MKGVMMMNDLSEIVGRLLNRDPPRPTRPKESSSTAGEFAQSLQVSLKGAETAGASEKASVVSATLLDDELAAVHRVTATVDEAAQALDHLIEIKRLLLAASGQSR